MNTRYNMTLIALALVGALISTGAAADDRKYYSGTECSAYYGSQASRFSHSGGIRNISGTRTWVVCPVISDRYWYNSEINRAWIRVNRAFPLNGIYRQDVCHLMARRTTAGSISFVTVAFDTQGSTVETFPFLENQTRFAVSWIQCYLAGGSTIESYSVQESTGTD